MSFLISWLMFNEFGQTDILLFLTPQTPDSIIARKDGLNDIYTIIKYNRFR